MTNISEFVRKRAVENLFKMSTFRDCWSTWQPIIRTAIGTPFTDSGILNLGDQLSTIFKSTGGAGRAQSELSGGGAAWEGLVCWYLNLCLVGTRSVVIKQNRSLIPTPLANAFTVKYGSVSSNTESDLVGITFPDKAEYTDDISLISIAGIRTNRRGGAFNYLELINHLCNRDFVSYEANIIQCKTNWNDNAQIPMLWDMVYASRGFTNTYISVGANNYQIGSLKRFTYSFVTVPSNSKANYTQSSVAVQRVTSLSGGNYWGRPTDPLVATSLKDFFIRNFAGSTSATGIRGTIGSALPSMSTTYSYFRL